MLRKRSADQRARQECLFSPRECAPPSLLAESMSGQEPAPPALTVLSATRGEKQKALRIPASLHRPVAHQADQAATQLRPAVLPLGAELRTAATRAGGAFASTATRVRALRPPVRPCAPTQPQALAHGSLPHRRP